MAMAHERYERVAMDGAAPGRRALVSVPLSNNRRGCRAMVRRPRWWTAVSQHRCR